MPKGLKISVELQAFMATPSLRQQWMDIISKAETSFMQSLIDHYATTECNLYEENTELEQELELESNIPNRQNPSMQQPLRKQTSPKNREFLGKEQPRNFNTRPTLTLETSPKTTPDPEDTTHHPTTTQITGTNETNRIQTTEAQGTPILTTNEENLPLTHTDPILKDSPTKDNGQDFQIQPKPMLRQPLRVFPTKALETQDTDLNPPSN